MFGNFYRGKSVVVAGHSGFKGGWLALWLKQLGGQVFGVGLEAPTKPSLYEIVRGRAFDGEAEVDVRDVAALESALRQFNPDLIFHLAAQPIVRASYTTSLETFAVNATGTANLLEVVRRLELPSTVIVVTSDKCYENRQWEYGYRECDPLGGHDVYSMSKAAAELIVQSWRRSFFIPNPSLGNIASVRAGNVIGGGDYATDRIVPDCIGALRQNHPILVRNPAATRPWQHVLDCLSGYLWLGARLTGAAKDSPLCSAFNFGPGLEANRTVADLVSEIVKIWPGKWQHVEQANSPHEAKQLNLSIDRASTFLGWFPTWGFAEAVSQTVSWYHQRHVLKEADMSLFSLAQIEKFTKAARQKGLAWAEPAA